jgi:hypothetical protein
MYLLASLIVVVIIALPAAAICYFGERLVPRDDHEDKESGL